jgi:hypothetical protein
MEAESVQEEKEGVVVAVELPLFGRGLKHCCGLICWDVLITSLMIISSFPLILSFHLSASIYGVLSSLSLMTPFISALVLFFANSYPPFPHSLIHLLSLAFHLTHTLSLSSSSFYE